MYPCHGSLSFTCFNLLQNFAAAFFFYFSLYTPLHGDNGTYAQIWVQISVMLFATCTFIIADYKYSKHPPLVPEYIHIPVHTKTMNITTISEYEQIKTNST
jgi:hypothetical protein